MDHFPDPPTGLDDGEGFAFEPESPQRAGMHGDDAASPALTILMVDDDADFQRSLRLALADFEFQGRPVELLLASTATEAAHLLCHREDIALVLLDVVMETDDAGLRLVRNVREVLGNAAVRIVLLTGQPGLAPMKNTLGQLDISDYWLKTELSVERLHGVLNSNLRTWEQIRALGRARRGLQSIVEASNSLNRAQTLADFSQRVMKELAGLLQLAPDGVVSVQDLGGDRAPVDARIIGAAGRLGHLVGDRLSAMADTTVRDQLVDALTRRSNVESSTSKVLYFGGGEQGLHAATYLATGRPLDATERELLRVFATNIHSGLINVALTSELERTAYEDPLLGIPNANAMIRSIEAVMEMTGPRHRAVLFLALDQYSASCLSLGMEQGDLTLRRMAARLHQVFTPPSLVARLHDDTFAILGPSSLLQQERIDELDAADTDDPAHQPFISVRAARLDLDRFDGSARGAMAAGVLLLRRARALGAIQMLEYPPGLQIEMSQRFTRSQELYRALQNDEIHIELQAQVELATGRVIGAEALARWTRADGSRIPPGDFIPIAEANGLIVPIGRRVLELACKALVRLREAGFPDLPVAVNVSALQLTHRDFMQELLEIARVHGVPHRLIEIEITESAAIRDHEADGALLRGLQDAGFPIAIDDFGTGYSSLGYLRSMPATTLKVDRCFVEEIGTIPRHMVIADMIIALGHRLKMRVLAEGVETQAQADWLREHACGHAQGYHFGRPEALDAFVERVRRASVAA
ncbi:MAG: EAL domain-containing protein [Comamonadaceae bacterium]|nr:MAG: EAL domain-containing protein [Comamonadaceae bacterium]